MPRKKKGSLSRTTSAARRNATARRAEPAEQHQSRLEGDRVWHQVSRSDETREQHQARLEGDCVRHQVSRSDETREQHQARLEGDCVRHQVSRSDETREQHQIRVEQQRQRQQMTRARTITQGGDHWSMEGFNYNPQKPYAEDEILQIGRMAEVCKYCKAKTWKKEPGGMCCSGGKVSLEPFQAPPQPLKDLLDGSAAASKHFLLNMRTYNSAFQMTSFGGNIIREGNFMPTFKVHGQVYHLIGSLQPQPNEQPKFLQIYLISDHNEQAQQRMRSPILREEIVLGIQEMLHATNSYVHSFKCALENAQLPEFKIVIDADKRPQGEHQRRFNAPTTNEVAAIISNEEHGHRDIVLQHRDARLKRIQETHRSYDALQYPLICVRGEDGYHFDIKQVDTTTREIVPSKTVSCKDFYAFHFMVRDDSFNLLHRTRDLFHQYAVDMYAKMEGERLLYFRTHQ